MYDNLSPSARKQRIELFEGSSSFLAFFYCTGITVYRSYETQYTRDQFYQYHWDSYNVLLPNFTHIKPYIEPALKHVLSYLPGFSDKETCFPIMQGSPELIPLGQDQPILWYPCISRLITETEQRFIFGFKDILTTQTKQKVTKRKLLDWADRVLLSTSNVGICVVFIQVYQTCNFLYSKNVNPFYRFTVN